jgi:hypothetical protein
MADNRFEGVMECCNFAVKLKRERKNNNNSTCTTGY